MRSSTFSSDRVTVTNSVSLRMVLIGIAAGLLLLGVIEFGWRAQGATTTYVDSKPRWSWVRGQANEQPGVVLLGDSRMHFGFSLEAFRDRNPGIPIHQLAVAGEQPYATLQDLALDEQFVGTVITSFTPSDVMAFRRNQQQARVDHYHDRWKIDTRLNFHIGSLFESALVTRHPNYSVNSIMRSMVSTRAMPPATMYMQTNSDREVLADYTFENIDEHRSRRENAARELYEQLHPVSLEAWQVELGDFLGLAKRIIDRGGCVIVVRFPSQDDMYEYEERLFPKLQYWASLERDSGIRTVHFEDMEIMKTIHLPDMQHVSRQDKYRFTEALLDKISTTQTADYSRCSL